MHPGVAQRTAAKKAATLFNIQATHRKTSTGLNFKAFELWEPTLTEIWLKKQWLELIRKEDFHTRLFLASQTSEIVTSDTYITSFQQEHDSKSKRMNQHESPKTEMFPPAASTFSLFYFLKKSEAKMAKRHPMAWLWTRLWLCST